MIFSIVIPIYNMERYLQPCLDSVMNQTFHDYEVILVDDGSSDGSAGICDAFCECRPGVRVLHKENEGRLFARRDGARLAQGDYLLFLDADDCLREDALEICHQAIERHSPDVVGFLSSFESDFSKYENWSGLNAGCYDGENAQEFRKAVCSGRFHAIVDKAMKRELFDAEADYSKYKGLMYGEDLFQLMPFIGRAKSYAFVDEALYYYRQHSESTMHNYVRKELDDLLVALDRLLSYAEKWGSSCRRAAEEGALAQFCTLLKLLEGSNLDKEKKSLEYQAIGHAIRGLDGTVLAATDRLRLDNRVLLNSMINGRYGLAALVIRTVDLLKKLKK